MDDQYPALLWRSPRDDVSTTARAYQIIRRLRLVLDFSGDNILRSVSGNDFATLLELRDFAEAEASGSALIADQLFMRNRNGIKNLHSRGLIERVEGSGIRWEVTREGLDAANAVEPIIEEVCSYC